VDDIVEVLREASRAKDADTWVIGQGNLFLDRKLSDRRMPSRADLDRASATVPIALRAGGHITILNSRALEVAGIDRDFEPPSYSVTGLPVVERDASGEPTGVVKEMDKLLPFPDLHGADLRAALKDGAIELFTRHGVTTIGEISETIEGLECMDSLAEAGDLPVSVAAYLWAPGTMTAEQACAWQDHLTLRAPEQRMRVQGLKLFADGGFTAASAAVKRPYAVEPHGCGSLAFTADEFDRIIRAAAPAGLQLAVHANGERAQELVCERLAEAGDLDWRLRPRIEHAGNFVPDWSLTDHWRRADILPVPQPVFLYAIGDFMPEYVGEYGRSGQFWLRRMLDDGWRLSTSSDVWVGSELGQTNPLLAIFSAVHRQSYTGGRIEPEQAITVEEALRMCTIDGATILGMEHERGSLEAGKRADVIVLDRDPRTVPPEELLDVQVDFVFVEGRMAYERPGAVQPAHRAPQGGPHGH
jgi:predicted amidohydrolase YtcJ